MCLRPFEGLEVYVDDIVIFSEIWEEHLKRLEQILFQLKQVNVTVNLSKRNFVKAKVVYAGYVIGHGVVTPIKAKGKSINDYPIPENKKSLMRFWEWKAIIENFSEATALLTQLLKQGVKYHV